MERFGLNYEDSWSKRFEKLDKKVIRNENGRDSVCIIYCYTCMKFVMFGWVKIFFCLKNKIFVCKEIVRCVIMSLLS